jgi:hypothetical protein
MGSLAVSTLSLGQSRTMAPRSAVSPLNRLLLISALSLGRHERRRALFTPLFAPNFHAVSPCYAYRHQLEAETDHQYVQRLAQELEDKFQTLGPDTVAAFFMEPSESLSLSSFSLMRSRWRNNRLRAVCSGLHEGHARNMPPARCALCSGRGESPSPLNA